VKNNNWKVYLHIFPDCTIYVGITSNELKNRWGKNGYRYKGQKVYEIIQKYDWETEVKHILLADNLSMDDAGDIERLIIKEMRERAPYFIRYNIADGGYDKFSPQETKIVSQYDLEGNLIKTYQSMTDAASVTVGSKNIGLISLACHEKTKTSGGFQWRFGEEEKISSVRYTEIGIPIDQFDLNGKYLKTFKSAYQAEKELNLKGHITECCNGERRMCGQYQWKYHENVPHCDPLPRKKNARIIDQYTLEGEYIQTWIGLEDLQTYLNINSRPVHILDVCNNKRKTAYGYLWKFNPQDNAKKYDYSKSVAKYTLNNIFIEEYDNIKIAVEKNPGTRKDHIYECCEGKSKTHKGFIWKYI